MHECQVLAISGNIRFSLLLPPTFRPAPQSAHCVRRNTDKMRTFTSSSFPEAKKTSPPKNLLGLEAIPTLPALSATYTHAPTNDGHTAASRVTLSTPDMPFTQMTPRQKGNVRRRSVHTQIHWFLTNPHVSIVSHPSISNPPDSFQNMHPALFFWGITHPPPQNIMSLVPR